VTTVRTIDAELRVYSASDLESPVITTVPADAEIQFGDSAVLSDGREWMPVALDDGQTGWALGPAVRGHTSLSGTAPPCVPASSADPPPRYSVQLPGGEQRRFGTPDDLRDAILRGEIERSAVLAGAALPAAKTGLTVEQWATSNDRLRFLYQPIWFHTMKGALWGGLIVAGLKLIDTFVGIARINGEAALLFLIVMAFMFSPKYKPQIAIAGFLLFQQSHLKFAAISTFLGVPLGVGAFALVFGATAGMVLGTLVGYVRAPRLATAPDRVAEGARPALWGLAVPATVFTLGGLLYLRVLMPWMLSEAGKP
jgi:hypothetical protein